MGLHLPEAPSSDSDEDDHDGAAAERSSASIPMDAGQSPPPHPPNLLVMIWDHVNE